MTVPDFTPRPDEVTGILQRAQRRRTRRAAEALGGLGFALLLVAATVGNGPTDRASVEITDDPSATASASPDPEASAGGGAAPSAAASADPAGSATARPVRTDDPTPRETPAGEPAGSASPADEPSTWRRSTIGRSTVAGRGATEQGCQSRVIDPRDPTYSAAGNTWCVIVDAATPTGRGSGASVYPMGGGATTSSAGTAPGVYEFRFSVCRQADARDDLRLSFEDNREVEFRVRRGFDGPVVWSSLTPVIGGPHSLTVRRSDCIQWQLDWDPVDDAGQPLADGEYVIEGLSLAAEISKLPGTGINFRIGEAS